MAQKTNLNISPYFDDFNEDKNYKRVLFKPGTTVQARELTTLQTQLQYQIEQFGEHFFNNGDKVIPGNTAYIGQYDCVLIDSTFGGIDVSTYLSKLVGRKIRGKRSGITAKVRNYVVAIDSDIQINTIYVKYLSPSTIDNNTKEFLDDEDLILDDGDDLVAGTNTFKAGTSFANTITLNSSRTGTAASIDEGVYFIRGFFVKVPRNTIILDQYSTKSSYRVGLLIDENVVTPYDDPTLFDNASGFSNFSAPGADRLQITTTFVKKSLDAFNDENFIELFRVKDGRVIQTITPKKIQVDDQIRDEIARRTYDTSGDYVVNPFTVKVRDSVDDYVDRDGLYTEGQKTAEGNTPTDSLLVYQVSKGKAYIQGYEVNKTTQSYLDAEKPRTKKEIAPEYFPFNMGNVLKLNRVYGSPRIGLGLTSYVSFRDTRVHTSGITTGSEIGNARVYDIQLTPDMVAYGAGPNGAISGDATTFNLFLFDIHTYTKLKLTSNIDVQIPALIEGKSSGARGYLTSTVSNNKNLTLSSLTGQFIKDEQIIIDGIEFGHQISKIFDYRIQDISSVEAKTGAGVTIFTADAVLSNSIAIDDVSSTFSIGDALSGITTITASKARFTSDRVNEGDIISYQFGGNLYYNQVVDINDALSIRVRPVQSVSQVNIGSVLNNTTVNNIKVVYTNLGDRNKADLLSPLPNPFVSTVSFDPIDPPEIIVREQFDITISGGTGSVSVTGDKEFVDFSSNDYLLYDEDSGVVENITQSKFSLNATRKTLTLSGITSVTGVSRLNATLQITDVNAKIKKLTKCSVLTISNTGKKTAYNGLSVNGTFGLRVEDDTISLNKPDCLRIRAIYQSSSDADPTLPTLTLTNVSASISDNGIVGETVLGNTSGAVGVLIRNTDSTTINVIRSNKISFKVGETITFKNSKIVANVSSFTVGDTNIVAQYNFDSGQRDDYCDFGRIIRKEKSKVPNRRLTVVFDYYTIDSTVPGDFVCVNSYGEENYRENLPVFGGKRLSDFLDFRPRVKDYNTSSSYSPFQYEARNFDIDANQNPYVMASGKSIKLGFSYYLGRVDKIVVDKNGKFSVIQGPPSEFQIVPQTPVGTMHIATAFLPPYLFDRDEARVTFPSYRRYTMDDISRLEDRIKNLEYYTQLSLLEMDTSKLTIKDETTGLDRFKSGFFVDNFKSHAAHDLRLFRASIDMEDGCCRPSHFTTGIDLALGIELDEDPNEDAKNIDGVVSPNIRKTGDLITLDYAEVEALESVFATKSIRINPFDVENWIGKVKLSPESDIWIDERNVEATVEDLKGDYSTMIDIFQKDPLPGFVPIDWKSWVMYHTGIPNENAGKNNLKGLDASRLTSGVVDVGRDTAQDRYAFNSSETRSGVQYKSSPATYKESKAKKFINKNIITYMRSRNVEFNATRLKPRTEFFIFFDGKNVTKYCVPKFIEIEMLNGTFEVGESVYGQAADNEKDQIVENDPSIRFRLAHPRHKEGLYYDPDELYTYAPYDTQGKIGDFPGGNNISKYTSTSTLLNVDTSALGLASETRFNGFIESGMILLGQNSQSRARIKRVRFITDIFGDLIGSFYIPKWKKGSGVPRFTSGAKSFIIMNSSSSNVVDINNRSARNISIAETIFESTGTVDTTQSAVVSVRNGVFEKTSLKDDLVISSKDERDKNQESMLTKQPEPLFQTFKVIERGGIFATSIDLFFKAKPTKKSERKDADVKSGADDLATAINTPVTIQIRTTENGYPTRIVLPFSEVQKRPDSIDTSDNATVATRFTFPSPVYLQGNGTQYAITLITSDDSYEVFVSQDGQRDIRESLTYITKIVPRKKTIKLEKKTPKLKPGFQNKDSKKSKKKKKDKGTGKDLTPIEFETEIITKEITENVTVTEVVDNRTIVISSRQPQIISLFRSSLGSLPTPSQSEDLKFKLYKAQFTFDNGVAKFYNSNLDYESLNQDILSENPLLMLSRQSLFVFSSPLTNTGILTTNSRIIQDTTNATGRIVLINGAVGVGTTSLTYLNTGIGLTPAVGVHTYSNVTLKQISRRLEDTEYESNNIASGLKANIVVTNGTVSSVNVTVGGTAFSVGDTVNASIGLANKVNFSVGIISAINAILIEDMQGDWNSSDKIYQLLNNNSKGVGIGTEFNLLSDPDDTTDIVRQGRYIRVNHKNHGMHARNNRVNFRGIKPDTSVVTLTSEIAADTTVNFPISNITSFETFEGLPVSVSNPGYAIVPGSGEIIKYTGVTTTTAPAGNLTDISREERDGYNKKTKGVNYKIGTKLRKYSIAGISLRRLNTEHAFSNVDNSLDITLDSYYIEVNVGASFVNSRGTTINLGKNRTSSNTALYLNDAKNVGGDMVVATNNIPFEAITPVVESFVPSETSISARLRTISGTSINNPNSISFIDQGFDDIQLNEINFFTTPRVIASIPNQDLHLRTFPGRRSLEMQLTLSTEDEDLSPVIDLERVFAITTTNRINSPYNDDDLIYVTKRGIKKEVLFDHDCVYVTKIVQLENPATSLQVQLLGYRPSGSRIRAQFRLFRNDSPSRRHDFVNFNAHGKPDTNPGISATKDPVITDYDDYKWTSIGLPLFNSFQVRIIMSTINQAQPPKIKDLRVIALA